MRSQFRFLFCTIVSFSLLILSSSEVTATSSISLRHKSTGVETSGKIYVDCNFDGLSRECILDTGAGMHLVPATPFFSMYPIVEKKMHGEPSGKSRTCDKIQVSRLRVGAMTLNQSPVLRCDGGHSAFLIGAPLFHKTTAYFDFDSNLLKVGATKRLKTHRSVQWLKSGQFTVPVKLNDSEFEAVFDTGADLTVVSRELALSDPESFRFSRKVATGKSPSGAEVDLDLYEIHGTFKILGVSLGDPCILVMDFSGLQEYWERRIDIILGYNHIVQQNWYFDFNQSELALEKGPFK